MRDFEIEEIQGTLEQTILETFGVTVLLFGASEGAGPKVSVSLKEHGNARKAVFVAFLQKKLDSVMDGRILSSWLMLVF